MFNQEIFLMPFISHLQNTLHLLFRKCQSSLWWKEKQWINKVGVFYMKSVLHDVYTVSKFSPVYVWGVGVLERWLTLVPEKLQKPCHIFMHECSDTVVVKTMHELGCTSPVQERDTGVTYCHLLWTLCFSVLASLSTQNYLSLGKSMDR